MSSPTIRSSRLLAVLFGALFALALLAGPAAAQQDPYTQTGGGTQGNQGSGSVLGSSTGSSGGTSGGSQGGALAVTGGEATTLAVIGVALLAGGVAIVTMAGRRKTVTA